MRFETSALGRVARRSPAPGRLCRRGTGLAAALLASLLAGCAAAPAHGLVPAAFPGSVATAPHAADRHAADRRLVPPDLVFTLSDGARLPARTWMPKGRPRAVILALHGFNDSRDAWELPAPVLVAQGLAVVAPDQRGFGAAPGRGRWAGTARMVDDARELALQLEARMPGIPLYVMGESMGGAVALCLAARPDAPPLAGTILLAPAVWSSGQMNAAMNASLWAVATFLPDWKLTGRELPLHIVASDNRAALYRLAYDPLTLGETRAATLRGLVALMTQAQAAAAHVRGPVLIAYGGHDELVPQASMAATFSSLPAAARRSFYPAGYHLLMRDRARLAVIDDVASWIVTPERPLPSGGDVAAAGWAAARGWDAAVPAWLPANLDGLAGEDARPRG